jgi:hypothetical protein
MDCVTRWVTLKKKISSSQESFLVANGLILKLPTWFAYLARVLNQTIL